MTANDRHQLSPSDRSNSAMVSFNGADLETAEHAPERVERCGKVDTRVGVDSYDDTARFSVRS